MLGFHGNPEGSRYVLECQCDFRGEEKAHKKNNREEGHFTVHTVGVVLEHAVGLDWGEGEERSQAPRVEWQMSRRAQDTPQMQLRGLL